MIRAPVPALRASLQSEVSHVKKSALAVAIACSSLFAGATQAGLPFDQFIAFGASYDDSGQYPDVELDRAQGLRFTNVDPLTGERGRSFPEWLALDLGIGEMNPSAPLQVTRPDFPPRAAPLDTSSINFATGGYRADQVLESVVGTQTVAVSIYSNSQPGFLARVAAGTLTFGPSTLFYALPAGNDVRDLADPELTADTSARIVQALVDAGARYIVLPTLPKLGNFAELPNFDANGRTQLGLDRTATAIAFNTAFEQRLDAIPGNFIRVDVATLFDEMLASSGSFGFAADLDQATVCYNARSLAIVLGVVDICQEPPGRGFSSNGDPDQFVFHDGLHPTQAAAHVAADLIESVIRAPGTAALLPETVLGDARAYGNAIDDYLVQNRWGEAAGRTQLFAAVQGVSVDMKETRATPEASSDATDLTLGGSIGLGNGWLLGAAVGSQASEADIDDLGSGFESSGLMGSVFAGYRCDIWFADAVLSAGQSDLEDIERVFNIGSVQLRREQGETEADVLGLALDVGVDMMPKDAGWRFGPFLAMEYTDITVDGYVEESASSSAMAFGDLDRESLLGRAGVFASWPLALGGADVELYGDVAYFEEFEDETDAVEAVSKTLASGPWFRMPGYEIDESGMRAMLGADARWNSGLSLGLSYRYDDNDAEAQYLNLSASYAL
jgi:outer membrane lipase/esterase